ncbi:MAG: hypothetical protein HY982_02960 [Candidatus Magasanikbacteria bacterium]|nr:hypothetical protein [Candidatus Magasanikbacteria bacterium]
MNKKIFGVVFFLAAILVFTGAGCGNTAVVPTIINEPVTQEKTVTIEECAELFAFAPKIDLRYNSLPSSYPWTLKYYDRMAALEKKYSITQDELSQICKAKSKEKGFEEKVKEQAQKLGI